MKKTNRRCEAATSLPQAVAQSRGRSDWNTTGAKRVCLDGQSRSFGCAFRFWRLFNIQKSLVRKTKQVLRRSYLAAAGRRAVRTVAARLRVGTVKERSDPAFQPLIDSFHILCSHSIDSGYLSADTRR